MGDATETPCPKCGGDGIADFNYNGDPIRCSCRMLQRVTHLKTGNVYEVVSRNARDNTNATEGREMVVYRRFRYGLPSGVLEVREKSEFDAKFKPIELPS